MLVFVSIWALLGDAFDKQEFKKYDEATSSYELWRRGPGMSMDAFIQGLKKRKTIFGTWNTDENGWLSFAEVEREKP